MKGIFVHEDKVPYAHLIARGNKLIETRTKRTLHSCLGERVAIIATAKGKRPMVVGYADVVWEEFFSADYLNAIRHATYIPVGDEFDRYVERDGVKGKWCYYMGWASACTPFPLPDDAVRHGRAWCEF